MFAGVLNDPDKDMVDVTVAIKSIKCTVLIGILITDVNMYMCMYTTDTHTHTKEQLNTFLAESLIMKDFHHPHILGLLGVCFDAPDGSPYIVLPFMANGSVKTYLKEKRAHVLDVDSYPKVCDLTIVCMCMLYSGTSISQTPITERHCTIPREWYFVIFNQYCKNEKH